VGSTVSLLPSGGWSNYTVQTTRAHLFGGTDGTYAISTAADATAVFTHTVPAAGAYEILLSKPYVAPPPIVNSDAVLLCSILFYTVILTSLVLYVAPPPLVNSEVIVNNALCFAHSLL
jgi:hypothetical protein